MNHAAKCLVRRDRFQRGLRLELLEDRHVLDGVALPDIPIEMADVGDYADEQLTVQVDLPREGRHYVTQQPRILLHGAITPPYAQSVSVNGYLVSDVSDTGEWHFPVGHSTIRGDQVVLVPARSDWRYADHGVDLGNTWRSMDYNDTSWSLGPAPLGYGNGDESTTVQFVDSNPVLPGVQRNATTYFRRDFHLSDVTTLNSLSLRLMYDDAAVVYVNGIAVARTLGLSNQPRYNEYATELIAGDDENRYFDLPVNLNAQEILREGQNTIAVEVHQQSPTSPDMRFDLELVALPVDSGQSTTGPVLYPGINRLLVESFRGPFGTGERIAEKYINILYTGTDLVPEVNYQPPEIHRAELVTMGRYDASIPLLVRVNALTADGQIARDLWRTTAYLSSDNPAVSLSPAVVDLVNGVGSALIQIAGSEPFTLQAHVGQTTDTKRLDPVVFRTRAQFAGALPVGITHWSGTVHLTGDVIVPPLARLNILPGTSIIVDSMSSTGNEPIGMMIEGQIVARGTAEEPITITTAEVDKSWGNLDFNGGTGELSHLLITHGAAASPSTSSERNSVIRLRNNAHVTMDHTVISDSVGAAVVATNSAISISQTLFTRLPAGIDVVSAELHVEESWFVDIDGRHQQPGTAWSSDAIRIRSARGEVRSTIRNSIVAHVAEDGLDIEEGVVDVTETMIHDVVETGVNIKGGEIIVDGLVIEQAHDGVVAHYSESSPTFVVVRHATIAGTNVGIRTVNDTSQPTLGNVAVSVTSSIIKTIPTGIAVADTGDRTTIHVSYSNLSTYWPGTENSLAKPMWARPAEHNYRLLPGSPSINAGDPTSLDADGSRADQGFYRNGLSGQMADTFALETSIDQDLVLAPWRGPFRVSGIVTVAPQARLIVLPGTTIYFDPMAELVVRGAILGEGNRTARIRWTSDPLSSDIADLPGLPAGPPRWAGIHLHETRSLDNFLAYSDIEYAQHPDGAIGLLQSDMRLDHITISGTHRRLIYGEDTSLSLTRSYFPQIFSASENPGQLGLSRAAEQVKLIGSPPANGHVIIRGNTFDKSSGQNDVLYIETGLSSSSIVQIVDNLFHGTGDEIIDVHGDAYIAGNLFSNVFRDDDLDSHDISVAISAHPVDASSKLVVVRNRFVNVDHAVQVAAGTSLLFEHNTVLHINPDFTDQRGNQQLTGVIRLSDGPENAVKHVKASFEANILHDVQRVFTGLDHAATLTSELNFHHNLIDPRLVSELLPGTSTSLLEADTEIIVGDPLFAQRNDLSLRLGETSPALGAGPMGRDIGAAIRDGIWISGEPPLVTGSNQATFTIGGPGLAAYQYRLDDGLWSTTLAIPDQVAGPDHTFRFSTIGLTGLTTGSHRLEVRGRDFAGNWQTLPTASRKWTVSGLRVSEIMYHANPLDSSPFIELVNTSHEPIDVGGIVVDGDIRMSLPSIVVDAGSRFVVAGNLPQFLDTYGNRLALVGEYNGSFGPVEGRFRLRYRNSPEPLLDVRFRRSDHPNANGGGYAIEALDLNAPVEAWQDLSHWRAGVVRRGTPGTESARAVEPLAITIQELRLDTGPGSKSMLELYNALPTAVDISGWSVDFLSHDMTNATLTQCQVTGTTKVPAGSFALLHVEQLVDLSTQHFCDVPAAALQNSTLMLVSHAMTSDNMRVVDAVKIGSIQPGESWGRVHHDSKRNFVPLHVPTLGKANSSARSGIVRISEVNYAATAPSPAALAIDSGLTTNDLTFFEIHNATNHSMSLAGWRIRGNVEFEFNGTVIADGGQNIVVVPFNTSGTFGSRRALAFRAHYQLDAAVKLVGPYRGQLTSPAGELILERPVGSDAASTIHSWVDQAAYRAEAPWANVITNGQSLQRTRVSTFGMFAGAWQGASADPGTTRWFGAQTGDVTGDSVVDAVDLDFLTHAANIAAPHLSLDQDGNRIFDRNDVRFVIEQTLQTTYGDANLDGRVDALDATIVLTHLFQRDCVGWAYGDFNGDGSVDGADFQIWNQFKFQTVRPGLAPHLRAVLARRNTKSHDVPRQAADAFFRSYRE